MRDFLRDRRVWTGVGTVVKRPDEDSHWRFATDEHGHNVDVLVECDLHPGPTPVECRLASVSGGAGHGLWKIPPVGTQVVITIQRGELEADCCIVGTLATNQVPSGLDEDTLVLLNPKNVLIKSDSGDININASGQVILQGDGSSEQPVARKTDPVNIGTFVVKGVSNAFTGIIWYPPGADTTNPANGTVLIINPAGTVPSPPDAVALTAKIKDGSGKTKSG